MRCGTNRDTGELLLGWDECVQSIGMIVSTAIGSLALGRDFGSDGPALQDRPMNPPSIMDHFMAIAEALRREEPGFALRKVSVLQADAAGAVRFLARGDFYPNGHLGDYSIVETDRATRLGGAA
jgi:hypothetical protein